VTSKRAPPSDSPDCGSTVSSPELFANVDAYQEVMGFAGIRDRATLAAAGREARRAVQAYNMAQLGVDVVATPALRLFAPGAPLTPLLCSPPEARDLGELTRDGLLRLRARLTSEGVAAESVGGAYGALDSMMHQALDSLAEWPADSLRRVKLESRDCVLELESRLRQAPSTALHMSLAIGEFSDDEILVFASYASRVSYPHPLFLFEERTAMMRTCTQRRGGAVGAKLREAFAAKVWRALLGSGSAAATLVLSVSNERSMPLGRRVLERATRLGWSVEEGERGTSIATKRWEDCLVAFV
jgi:hypothetical protein